MKKPTKKYNSAAPHISFFKKLDATIQTSDGKTVELWELLHNNDPVILSAWAKHFREHYCRDSDIDIFRDGTGMSRRDFLNAIKFPSKTSFGPAARSGDFAEILVADFLEFIGKYEMLCRYTRYDNKTNPNSSTQGSDVIGFRFVNKQKWTPKDELIVYEIKAKLTGSKKEAKSRLKDAIVDSEKDKYRIGTSLAAMKQRLFEKRMREEGLKVSRFQNEADNPYRTLNGAVVLVSNSNYSDSIATDANTSGHSLKNSLRLIIIMGENMMQLVHDLYERAANEA